MSYQVLARKWRPNKFSELVGQEHVVTAISHALDNDRLHHAYLFTGTRGVGKTTIARIFSKSLNCDEGQSAHPCGVCDTCKSIEQGNFVDLLEIDAASRTKVEDTRELLDNVQYKPTRGRFKVYLIDEVHMLSKHSFNALLKTLEEPPPHVKFLLATTDPQKLPVTILSRCLQFNLKALSREQIAKQLAHVLEKESIPFDAPALSLLARAAQGSMRDALSLTDQAIAQGNNTVNKAIVTDMLGLMDKQILLKLLNAVVDKQKSQILQLVEQLAVQAPDYGHVLMELSSLLHQIALTQWEPEVCKLETSSARAIFELAKRLSGEHIQLLYKLVLEGIKELPISVDGKTCLQMTLLRMTSFAPINALDTQANQRQEIIQNADIPAPMDLPADEIQGPTQSDAELDSLENEQQQLEQQKLAQQEPPPQRPTSEEAENAPLQGIDKTRALLALKQSLTQSEGVTKTNDGGLETGKKSSDVSRLVEQSQAKSLLDETPPVEPSFQAFEDDAPYANEPPPWVLDAPNDTQIEHVDNQQQASADITTIEHSAPEPAPALNAFLDNGDKLVHAKQVNRWSELIESSELNGLDKQIALNSSFSKQDNCVKLLVEHAQEHLINDASLTNITQALSAVLGQAVNVEIAIGEPSNTPAHIQQQINQIRQQHAQTVVESDESIQGLINAFDAQIDSSSIKAR